MKLKDVKKPEKPKRHWFLQPMGMDENIVRQFPAKRVILDEGDRPKRDEI